MACRRVIFCSLASFVLIVSTTSFVNGECNPDTEVFGCFQRCDKNCTPSDDYCFNENCTEQCFCKAGYARDEAGVCVPYEKCSQASKCPENEEFGCHRTCPPKRCISLHAMFKCIPFSHINCTVKCDCKEGFLRNALGNCIDPEACTEADNGL